MTMDSAAWMKDVMADASWIRRLAGALVGDPEAALDAVQDSWVRTQGRIDGQVARPRGWLRAVLGNSLRAQRRSQRRRQVREQVGAAAQPLHAPSPEELLGRLEVQRTLATLVEALGEPARQVILLHYYEGMTLAAIAASTGTPAGTVRWRLKTALEELRERLQKRYGDQQKDWRMALLPLVPAADKSPTAAASASGFTRGRLALFGAGLASLTLVLALGGRLVGCGAASQSTVLRLSEPVAPARAGTAAPGGRSNNPRGLKLAAAALPSDCPADIARLEEARASAAVALAHYLPVQILWADAGVEARNDQATRTMAPLFDRWLDQLGAPRQGRSFECRDDSCVGTVTEPYPPKPPWVHRQNKVEVAGDLRARTRSLALEGPKKLEGPGAPQGETQAWLRLNDATGAAVPAPPPPPFPPELLPSASLNRAGTGVPTAETPRTEACRERTAAAAAALEKLRGRALRLAPAAILFANERPDPALTLRINALAAEALAKSPGLSADERASNLSVLCRGLVCQVQIPPGVEVRDHLIRSFLDEGPLAAVLGRVSVHTRNGRVDEPPYFTVLPAPDETSEGDLILRALAKRLWKGGVVRQACPAGASVEGKLRARLVLPATGETNDDGVPGKISVHLTGPLADSPFGQCVWGAIAKTTAAVSLPSEVSRGELSPEFKLPW
jgi:RNA polymerase sigma factor (sigma-70 family)